MVLGEEFHVGHNLDCPVELVLDIRVQLGSLHLGDLEVPWHIILLCEVDKLLLLLSQLRF